MKLNVKGMHCKSCETILSEDIAEIKGAKLTSIDYRKGVVDVQCDSEATLEKVKQAIRKEGYEV